MKIAITGANSSVGNVLLRHLPGEPEDEQSRYLEVLIESPRPVRVGSVYLPNGNPRPGEKYDYKLRWMDRLIRHARDLLKREEIVVLGGDFNVCPSDEDVFDVHAMADDALCQVETRQRWRPRHRRFRAAPVGPRPDAR